ncbi:MAG TPA: bifunctional GNAT family N-acetyltransferase/acetate--CoA ligase family protein [Jatrophihabitans sp.]|nr:bifunctional GNAT family N-acetyltransferase/acetate--CoA ligase family protein [Jatrophihabitans sp.]
MTRGTDTGYPPHWEADALVADGGAVHLRPIVPDDADALVRLHAGLSIRTRYLRYFSAYPTIPPRDLVRFSNVDNVDRVALAVWLGGEIIAVGRFDRLSADAGTVGDTAEVAFVVADAHQGRGIGSVLLEHLVEIGRELDVARFEAVVLAENQQMMRVFLDAGFAPSRRLEGSEVSLRFDIAATELTQKVMAERELRADARSIHRLLHPRSVAVVGASADPDKIGHLVVDNLQRAGFTGPVYPVNPHAGLVNSILAYPSLADVPGDIDLAVLAVPAAEILQLVQQCSARGVHGLVVLSAGFGESGDAETRQAGRAAQRALVSQARANGMRVVGPNCLGVLNTDPAVALNASIAAVAPLAGRAGFFCQSGALGAAVLGEAARRGLGISSFVSAGNRADVSGNDLLQYWETDPQTDIALLYLESFGNPRKFARIARRLARHKPIVAVKSGRGSVVAGLQHTSVEVPEHSVQALFEASGVIRTGTIGELFDVALLLATQPLPAGDRVAVVGHSTALGVLVADALATAGLPLAGVVDVGVDATDEAFGRALSQALSDEQVDAVISIFVPPMRRGAEAAVAGQLRQAAAGQAKPVLSTFLGFEGVPAELAAPGGTAGSIPSYPSPERAVQALAQVVRYARWRRRDVGRIPQLTGVDTDAAREFVTRVLADRPAGRPLELGEARRLLAWYGISLVAAEPVSNAEQAIEAAGRLGWPVALKVGGASRLHLADAGALVEAWHSLAGAGDRPVLVQAMAERGVDTVLRVQDDRSFGTLMSFGVGGLATDLLQDRSYAVVPLTSTDAAELIGGPKAFPLLTGYGGAEHADIAALVELALRLSRLADELPEAVECAMDPVVAAPSGAFVLSARILLAPPTARDDLRARRLRGL